MRPNIGPVLLVLPLRPAPPRPAALGDGELGDGEHLGDALRAKLGSGVSSRGPWVVS